MDNPPIFTADTFDRSLERATLAARWLIVDLTAEWCQPCKLMDRTTWRDPAVLAWVADHAIAIQVNVDVEEAIATRLAVAAMPTLIAFRDGEERDRVVGYQSAAQLLEWFAAIAQGVSTVDRLRQALIDPENDMSGRLKVAQALLQARRLDEATDEFAWLWHNMVQRQPAMTGVRVSFMASDIATLIARHPGARQRFTAIRGAIQRAAEGGDSEARGDWVVLNEMLEDDDRTLAWFDAAKADAAQADTLERLATHLVPKLRARRRWADIGGLHRDPLATLARTQEIASEAVAGLPAEMAGELRAAMTQFFRDEACLLSISLRAAGRANEAAQVEEEARRLDSSDELRTLLENARPD
jgi:thioredoxin 1